MGNKQFAERLNRELDAIGVPPRSEERVSVFAKLLKVPKFKADAYLNGITLPEPNIMDILAEELEVSADWLLGKSEQRQRKTRTS